MAGSDWNPESYVDYSGPYPVHQLQNARKTLINSLRFPNSELLKRVMPKFGISTVYGKAQRPPPFPSKLLHQQKLSEAHKSPQSLQLCETESKKDKVVDIDKQTTPAYFSNVRHYAVCSGSHDKPSTSQTANDFHKTDKSNAPYSTPNTKRVHDGDDGNIPMKRTNLQYKTESSETKSNSDVVDVTTLIKTNKLQEIMQTVNSLKDKSFEEESSAATTCISQSNTALQKIQRDPNMSESYLKRNRIPFIDSQSSQSESEIEPDNTDALVSNLQTITNFQVWKSSNPFGSSLSNIQSIVKCDTCCFACKDKISAQTHLDTACHSSASLYKATIKQNTVHLISVQNMLVTTNERAAFKKQVIACPQCCCIFKDVFMCALHYKKEHSSGTGYFMVCPVTSELELNVTTNECQSCNHCFDSLTELANHWKQTPKHNPVQKTPDSVCLVFCKGPKCTMLFYNLTGAIQHCRRHTSKQKNLYHIEHRNMLIVRSVSLIAPRQELPAFDSEHQNARCMELKVLKEMKYFHKNGLKMSKSKYRELRKDHMALKRMLECRVGKNEEQAEYSDEEEYEEEYEEL